MGNAHAYVTHKRHQFDRLGILHSNNELDRVKRVSYVEVSHNHNSPVKKDVVTAGPIGTLEKMIQIMHF